MTPEQRYQFDTLGYLHLKNVLTKEELRRAQDATDRYINMPPEKLPVGFCFRNFEHHKHYLRAFAFDRALEHLTMHPSVWQIIKEFTGNKPCLARANLICDTHEHEPLHIHNGPGQTMVLGVNGNGANSPRGFGAPGSLHCDHFNIFWYFTDVHPGDGGLLLAPGSHKSEFEFPFERVYQSVEDLPHGIVNIASSAGDAVIISEQVFHGSLKWKPVDRDRRVLVARYALQYQLSRQQDMNMEQTVLDRLTSETRELLETSWHSHEKEISKRDVIRLI